MPYTGTRHHLFRDLTGYRTGRLVVKRYIEHKNGKARWEVWCDCGAVITRVGSEITRNGRQSCGCLAREQAGLRLRTHGMSHHPAFGVWRAMIDRCHLPSHKAYKNYGARGITVCPEWHNTDKKGFRAFWADMGPTYQTGLELDRIDNNMGYSKENCRWTTRLTNSRNRRKNRPIDTPKGRMLVCEASEVSGINVTTLLYRLGSGWPTERLFDKPDFTNRV